MIQLKKLILLSFLLTASIIAIAIPSKIRVVGIGDLTTEMTVVFDAAPSGDAKIYFDTENHGNNYFNYAYVKSVDVVHPFLNMNNNVVRLTNLTPNTRYYFMVIDNQRASNVFFFETLPNNSEPLSIIAGGSSISNRSVRINANLMVSKLKPHAVLFGGDFTEFGSAHNWHNWFLDWNNTINSDGRMIPIVPARGNRESNNEILHKLFGVPIEGYYKSSLGNLLSVCTLNSENNYDDYALQSIWLKQTLDNENSRFKIVQYHQSIRPHTSSKIEGDTQYCFFPEIFEKHKVDLVIESDGNTLKRTWPIVSCDGGLNCDYGFKRDDKNGVVYIGEGGWGTPLRNADDTKLWTRDAASENQLKWIHVTPDKMKIRTVIHNNVYIISPLDYANRFNIPVNLNIWSPPGGEVIKIYNDDIYKPIISNQYPKENNIFVNINPIELSVDATDLDGFIDKVYFFINGYYIATEYISPYKISNWIPPGLNKYTLTTVAFDNSGNYTHSNSDFQVIAPNNRDYRGIENVTNDAEEYENGEIDLFNFDLDFGYDNYTTALRFTCLNIPQGAVITNAYIQFTSDEINTTTSALNICGEMSPHPASFKIDRFDITSRNTTQNFVNWNPSWWFSVGISELPQRTPDLTSIMNEIINQNNFTITSPIVFFIKGNGQRVAESSDSGVRTAPTIYYEYYVKNQEDCSTNLIINQNTDLSSLPYLCKSITTNGNLTINNSEDHNFKVAESVKLNTGFEVTKFSNFVLEVESCN